LINLLSSYLEDAGVEVLHAGEEGDADIIIVKKALQSTERHPIVKVVADDTDIFILLLFHLKDTIDIIMKTRRHTISIRGVWQHFREDLIESLLFAHAISGCDTTSAFFGQGKKKAFKMLLNDAKLREGVMTFGVCNTNLECLRVIGENFVLKMYNESDVNNLNELRYMYFASPNMYQ
jgi:hypothetical protein